MTKAFFYNEVKRVSQTLNIPVRGRWVGTTTQYWETQLNRLQFRNVLTQVRNRIPDVRQFRYTGGTPVELKSLISRYLRTGNYYFTFLDMDNTPINIRQPVLINSESLWRPYYDLHKVLESILENPTEYDIQTGHVIVQIHKQIIP